jgi:WD40 repeat protein
LQQRLVQMEKFLPLRSKLQLLVHHLIISLNYRPFVINNFLFAICSGDHTVKIIDCETGRCLKVLIGHMRTPCVVSLKSACLPEFLVHLFLVFFCLLLLVLIVVYRRNKCASSFPILVYVLNDYRLGSIHRIHKYWPVGAWIKKFDYGMLTHQSA